MLKNILEAIGPLLKDIICGVLLIAAAAAAVTFSYFVIMTCYRCIGSAWTHLFSKPFP